MPIERESGVRDVADCGGCKCPISDFSGKSDLGGPYSEAECGVGGPHFSLVRLRPFFFIPQPLCQIYRLESKFREREGEKKFSGLLGVRPGGRCSFFS